MTKAQIVSEISKKTGIDKSTALTAVEAFMEAVKESLIEKEENVYLRGFGSFILKKRAKRQPGIFPRTPQSSLMSTTFRRSNPRKYLWTQSRNESRIEDYRQIY